MPKQETGKFSALGPFLYQHVLRLAIVRSAIFNGIGGFFELQADGKFAFGAGCVRARVAVRSRSLLPTVNRFLAPS